MRAPGVSRRLGPHLVEDAGVEAFEQRDALPQRGGEVELAAHGRLGHLGHLGGAAGPVGEQVDDLVLDQRRVDVHHDQPHRPPVEAGPLHRHVHPAVDGHLGERVPQRHRVGPRHVELDAGHRVAGQPGDPVDVGAARPRSGPRRPRPRSGCSGLPSTVTCSRPLTRRGAGAGRRLGRAGGDLRLEAEVGRQVADGAVDRGQVGRLASQADEHAEHQPAPDRHLLDVGYAQREAREGAEQPRGDAGPVPAGQRDQERGP